MLINQTKTVTYDTIHFIVPVGKFVFDFSVAHIAYFTKINITSVNI